MKREGTPLLPGPSHSRSGASSTLRAILARVPSSGSLLHSELTTEVHDEASRLDEACYHLQDALDGVSREHPSVGGEAAYTLHLQLVGLYPVAAVLYVCLGFFEEPLWSRRLARTEGDAELDLFNSPLYPTFGLPLLSYGTALGLELACLATLAFDVALQLRIQGWRRYGRVTLQRVRCSLLGLAALDILVTAATGHTYWRLAPYLRGSLLVAYWSAVQQQAVLVRSALPTFAGVLILLLCYVSFSAWLAVLLFAAIGGDEYLGDFFNAQWDLLVLLTTANFPLVMLPAYSRNRSYAAFFLAYVCFGVFFLLNYVLAAVINPATLQPCNPAILRTYATQAVAVGAQTL